MNRHELEEGQIIMCTVDKIIGTTVFVKIENNGEATITMSEIAPGRIRNLREYVVAGKKIVCKILKIQGDRIILSLRRVKQQEKKELLDKIAKENSYRAMLKTVFGEKAQQFIEKITEEYAIIDFFAEGALKKEVFTTFLGKENAEKISKIIESKKEKAKEIKENIKLSSKADNGIVIIKDIFKQATKDTKCVVHYIAAQRYRILVHGENFKELKSQLNTTLEIIEKLAKKNKCFFEIEKN